MMRLLNIFVSAALLAAVFAGCAARQPVTVGDVSPGNTVRLTWRGPAEDTTATATMVRQVNGSIEVGRGPTPLAALQRVALLDLQRLEVRRGRDNLSAGLVGAAVGGLGGLLAGMACRTWCADGPGEGRNYAPLTGMALGSLLGGVSGALLAPVRWVQVRIR